MNHETAEKVRELWLQARDLEQQAEQYRGWQGG
jgi:hypothetical protein